MCGPTASGKSTVGKALARSVSSLCVSISTTTRAPREGESDGVDYHFVTEAEFARRVSEGLFLEHAVFGSERYGTEKRNTDRALIEKVDLLLTIDVQGVSFLKTHYPERTVVIFLFPPSFAVLEKRLAARATESMEETNKRLGIARKEIEILTSPGFSDYLVINDRVEDSLRSLRAICAAERGKLARIRKENLTQLVLK